MTRTLAIVAIVVASTLAPAHALTSREWQDACESPDLGQQALCATYAARRVRRHDVLASHGAENGDDLLPHLPPPTHRGADS
jgi:hypothetical protein